MCSPQQAPAAEQKAVTELPEWAKPYGKDILAKGAALTDVNQNPYQTYNQERLAGFSPMQQQAMQNAQGMSAAPQIGQGTAAAVGAGLGGASVAGQANPYGFQNQVGGYMNPYLQMSLAPQLAEANRNYDISGVNQQSKATQAGAFGGSREAIMAAENERNRNTGLSSIIGQGYNTAFGNAQQQYNQNLQNQLQGYGLLGSAANSLGQLGQNQYSQNMGINQLQAQYGGQQQAQMQKGLDTSYQDFLNQQNYPYKQLGFMSDLLRGTPTGSSSVTQMYQAPPTALQTVGALGMGAYGINQLTKADGGSVYEYADGGSVTSDNNIEAIINKLNPEQLQQAKQTALARRDMQTVEAIDQRLAELASEKSITSGIAGAMPQQMADGVMQAAGGGILAFEEGGPTSIELPQYAGNPALYKKFGEKAMSAIDAYSNVEAPRAYTPQEEEALDVRSMERAKKLIGPSPYAGMASQLEDIKTQGIEALRQGKGLAALAAMEGMLQPGGALRGLGRAGKNFAEAYAPAVRADQDLKKSTALMNINLANAQRAENMGLGKEARAYTDQAIAARKESARAGRELAEKEARLYVDAAKAFRPPAGKGAGGGPKPNYDIDTAAMIDKVVDLKRNPKADPNEIKALEDKIAGRTTYKTNVRDLPTNKKELEGGKLDLATADKAADAWGNMSGASKKSFAAANGFDVSRDPKTGKFVDPRWEEKSRQVHAQGFKPAGGGANPPAKKVVNLDND
jgi:hypothetical protein